MIKSGSSYVGLYCPNCGCKLHGPTDENGTLKLTCSRCRIIIVSKRRCGRVNMQLIDTK